MGFRLLLVQLKINTPDPQPLPSVTAVAAAVASVQLMSSRWRSLAGSAGSQSMQPNGRGGRLDVDASCESVVIRFSLEPNENSTSPGFSSPSF